MGEAKVTLTFALYQGEQLVRRDTVAQDIIKIGTDPRSHLRVVDDPTATRMHAVIEVLGPNDITLIDLGNEPCTMVNGQRVNKRKIQRGDQILIGSTMIHLESANLPGEPVGAPAPSFQLPPTPPPEPPLLPLPTRPESTSDKKKEEAESKAFVSLHAMLGSLKYFFSKRGYSQRKRFWWATKVVEREESKAKADASSQDDDETLAALGDQWGSFERKIDAELDELYASYELRFLSVFEPLDAAARHERWSQEQSIWVESLEGELVTKDLLISVGLSPDDDSGGRALLARGQDLRNRVGLARLRLRGMTIPKRNETLEAAIEAAPDDVAGYLVYADWLQEQGDPRGELISRSVDAESDSAWSRLPRIGLLPPLTEFMNAHWADLLGDLALHFAPMDLEWNLGFVSTASICVTREQAQAAEQGAGRLRASEIASALFAHPSGRFLRRLTLVGDGIDAAEVASIARTESKQLPALLRHLTVMLRIALSSDLASAILDAPMLAKLTILDLQYCECDASVGMQLLAFAKRLKHLDVLKINPTNLDPIILQRLRVACPNLQVEAPKSQTDQLVELLQTLSTALEEQGQTAATATALDNDAKPFFTPSLEKTLADINVAQHRKDDEKKER